MLVLSRRVDEDVVLVKDGKVLVRIVVVDIRTGVEHGEKKARLGFDAPSDIAIHRREVWETLQRQGKTRVNQ